MAQHIAIKEWMQEPWYTDIIKIMVDAVEQSKILVGTPKPNWKECTQLNHYIDQLPDDYLWKEKHPYDTKVLLVRLEDEPELYKKYKDIKLDAMIPEHSATNDIMVGRCNFEIHIDNRNHINDIYVPL